MMRISALAPCCVLLLSGFGVLLNVMPRVVGKEIIYMREGMGGPYPHERAIYGGTRFDVHRGWEGLTWPNPILGIPAAACWWGVDLPISFAGDTLTLPITVPITLKAQSEAAPAPNRESPSEPVARSPDANDNSVE